ncbi:MAG: cupredoxin domain-containing protein [Candidatus Bilamarchaeaceae archaeon]
MMMVKLMEMKMILLVLLAPMLLFGCIDTSGIIKSGDQGTATPVEEVKVPSFRISAPSQGEIIKTDADGVDISVTISTTNLVVKNPSSKKVMGEGHFSISLDNNPAVLSYDKTYEFKGVVPGEHTITVELVNNDHTKYVPAQVKKVTFLVEKTAPAVPQGASVTISSGKFAPQDVTVKAGGVVTWTNTDTMAHIITFLNMDGAESGVMATGGTYAITFSTPGAYDYMSKKIPTMTGTVTVVE